MQNGERLERSHPARAARLLQLPWIADGVDDSELEAAEGLIEAARWYPHVFYVLVRMSWVQDDITEAETTALRYLDGMAEATTAIIAMPWFADGVSDMEADALKYLSQISDRNADAAAALIAMPFLEFVEIRDTLALRSLNHISRRDANGFRELMSHPKIKDGITDEETKIVAVLGVHTYSQAPGSAQVLLAETGVYIQERLIELPHTGETLLAVIRVEDRVTPRMNHFEHAVRSIEEFMGVPFPIDYLALLYYDHQNSGATNNFTHLLLMAEFDSVDGPEWHTSIIAHEVAHWYWPTGEKWITEGSAEFLSIISEHERAGRPLEPIEGGPCPYFGSISELEKTNPDMQLPSGQTNPQAWCYYSLGERFFLDLYLTLGDETFRPAYRTLYLRSQDDYPTDGCGSAPLSICRVEAAFKDGASAEVVRKVDEVIDRWYYGK